MRPRLLANENFPRQSVALLREAGFDVLAIAESTRGIADHAVLDIAAEQQRWIITFDRDYGDLIFAKSLTPPPALVLLRLRSYRPDGPGRLLMRLMGRASEFIGHFVVVDDDGIRIRPLPKR
jgi:predicted nuclease of predicted toxin-antitoxin system